MAPADRWNPLKKSWRGRSLMRLINEFRHTGSHRAIVHPNINYQYCYNVKSVVKLLLLEGVCGAGKSTVSKALQKIGGEYEVVLLGQSFTYAPIAPAEDAGVLDNETNACFLGK